MRFYNGNVYTDTGELCKVLYFLELNKVMYWREGNNLKKSRADIPFFQNEQIDVRERKQILSDCLSNLMAVFLSFTGRKK